MDTETLRSLIPATEAVTYFNTGWAGPSSTVVIDRIADALRRESTTGPASLEGLRVAREANEEAQSEAALLFKCQPDDVLLTHGTTEGVHVVLHGIDWQAGDEMVTCSLEHMALATPTSTLAERYGVVPRRVELPPNGNRETILQMVADAITNKTRIIALSHIQFTCGLKLPVQEIADMAHAAGVPLLVDGAQTGGAIELDVDALGADFYAISGQKWVLGPLGTGALYVSPKHNRTIRPLFTTHALADERASHTEAPGANKPLSRFRVTSNSAALIAGFAEAMRLLRGVGFDKLEARSHELASRMKGGLAETSGAMLTGPTDDDVSSSLVSVALEGWEPGAIVEQLWERWRIGARAVNNPPAVRFAVAAFNTEAEVDKALEAVRALIREGPPA